MTLAVIVAMTCDNGIFRAKCARAQDLPPTSNSHHDFDIRCGKSSILVVSSSTLQPTMPTESAITLQERLHELLSRLANTMEVIQKWPESNDASVHVATTSQLIDAVQKVLASIEKVEGMVGGELKEQLLEHAVPLDLLDLLDHGDGLNPECFTRGLLQEALQQLKGLKRRKRALELLGEAVQKGLEMGGGVKRELEEGEEAVEEPPRKKIKSESAS